MGSPEAGPKKAAKDWRQTPWRVKAQPRAVTAATWSTVPQGQRLSVRVADGRRTAVRARACGVRIAPSDAEAALARRAVALGDAGAMLQLGERHARGVAVERDDAAAACVLPARRSSSSSYYYYY